MKKTTTLISLPGIPNALSKNRVPEKDRGKGKFSMSTSGTAAEIMLYGIIGWDECSAENIVGAIKNITASEIVLSINSAGGSVFDAVAIYNTLQQHPANVTINIDGLAASAASLIAMAGDTVSIGKNAFMMIHNAASMAFGTADELREVADILEKLSGSIAQTYADATGKGLGIIQGMMNAETWFTGEEAIAAGLADTLLSAKDDSEQSPAATVRDLTAFAKVPHQLQAAVTSAGAHYSSFLNYASDENANDFPAEPVAVTGNNHRAIASQEWDQHPELHEAWIDKVTFVASRSRELAAESQGEHAQGATSGHQATERRQSVLSTEAAVVTVEEQELQWDADWKANKENCRGENGFANRAIYIAFRRVEQRNLDRINRVTR